ncbi:MAG: hypothetical protein MUP27_15270, partial [Desulfobacterales bacterium]|nr:hypothetical protein [Desulfobacterales bacterium]
IPFFLSFRNMGGVSHLNAILPFSERRYQKEIAYLVWGLIDKTCASHFAKTSWPDTAIVKA